MTTQIHRVASAAAHGPRVRRLDSETLQDRWEGLLHDRRHPTEPSGLQNRLDAVLIELIVGVTRFEPQEKASEPEIVGDLESMIRDVILDAVLAGGHAR